MIALKKGYFVVYLTLMAYFVVGIMNEIYNQQGK